MLALLCFLWAWLSVEGAIPDTSAIASWNIRQFGITKMGRDSVVRTILGVIRQFDLVLIQELQNKPDGACGPHTGPVVCRLLARLPGYRAVLSPRPPGAREQYIALYRTDIWMVHPTIAPCMVNVSMKRPPHLVVFTRKGTGRHLVTLNVHTRPSDARQEVRELGRVAAHILEWARPMLGHRMIIGGDFNADGAYFREDRDWDAFFQYLPGFQHLVPLHLDTTVAPSNNTYDNLIASPGIVGWSAGVFSLSGRLEEIGYHACAPCCGFKRSHRRCVMGRWLDSNTVENLVSDHYPVYAWLWFGND